MATLACLCLASCGRQANQNAVFSFPFANQFWEVNAQGLKSLGKLDRTALGRSWERQGANYLAADLVGGSFLSWQPGHSPQVIRHGEWAWAGMGSGWAASAGKHWDQGFEFDFYAQNGRQPLFASVLDCFVSDAQFSPAGVWIAGSNQAGDAFQVFEGRAGTSAFKNIVRIPRSGGFLRLGQNPKGQPEFCFISASNAKDSGDLSVYDFAQSQTKTIVMARKPKLTNQGRAWFGSGWTDSDGRYCLPLLNADGGSALVRLEPEKLREVLRTDLPAPVYQYLGSSQGQDYAILYDHAKKPGYFRLAVLSPENSTILFELPDN